MPSVNFFSVSVLCEFNAKVLLDLLELVNDVDCRFSKVYASISESSFLRLSRTCSVSRNDSACMAHVLALRSVLSSDERYNRLCNISPPIPTTVD